MDKTILQSARSRALSFIKAEQGDDVALPIRVFNPDRSDRKVFFSAYAAMALSVEESAESLAIRRRLIQHLVAEREWFGTWRSWGKRHPVPCDLDVCSLCSSVLRLHGVASPSIEWLLKLHRLPGGMFLAWFMPGNVFTLHPLYWLAVLPSLTPRRLWFRFMGHWQGNCHRSHFNIVSNIHIQHYLGETRATSTAVDWMIRSVIAGEEDLYFRSMEVLYLSIGRARRAGLDRFQSLAALIAHRVRQRTDAEGMVGGSALSTAAAVAALLYLGSTDPVIHQSVTWLLASQNADGSWPASPLYYALPTSTTGWGSRSLTSSVVIEALALYEKYLEPSHDSCL